MDLPDTPRPRPVEPLILPSTASQFQTEADGNANGSGLQRRTTPQSPSTSTQTDFPMREVDHADYYGTETFLRYCKRHLKMIVATGLFTFLTVLVSCWIGYCAYYDTPSICYEHQYNVLGVVFFFTLIASIYGIASIVLDRLRGRNNRTGFTFNTTGFNY